MGVSRLELIRNEAAEEGRSLTEAELDDLT